MPVPSFPSLEGIDPKDPIAILGALANLQKELTWLLENLDEYNIPALKKAVSLSGVKVTGGIQSINPSTWTTVTFDSEVFDDGEYWDSSNPQNIVIEGPGRYLVVGEVKMTTTERTDRVVAIQLDSTNVAYQGAPALSSTFAYLNVTSVLSVGNGSHNLSLAVYHSSSSPEYVGSASLSVLKIG